MIPYSTDAPIYHPPIGTGLLIAANVICFIVHGALVPEHPWVLEFGSPPNPLEWLSSMFAHDGVVHLVGNMYFLAAFGLIVEGKLGLKRFVLLYLALGLTDSALTQLIMWPFEGTGAVGASSAIMGLMALCLIWAPKNEFSVFMILPMPLYFFRVFMFDVSILVYSILFILKELFWLMIFQFHMSTPALHMIGITVGVIAGTVYVKRGWVDCENWDLFAVMAGTHGRFGDETTTVGSHADASLLFGKDVDVAGLVVPDEGQTSSKKSDKSVDRARALIDAGHFMEASEVMFSLQLSNVEDQLEEARLKRLAIDLHDAHVYDEAEFFLEEYTARFASNADWSRLRLAHLQLTQRRRPRAAIEILRQVRLSKLPAGQQQKAKKLVTQAKKMIRAGIQDSEDEYTWGPE
jgi:membrane associated rhomboid family serine protease